MKNTKLSTILIVAFFANAVLAVQPVKRIRFARGKSAATIRGTVDNYGKREYFVGVKKSQTMSLKVTSGCKSVTLDVLYRETGESITDEQPSNVFRNTLPSAGDYIISVQNSDLPSCRYTLRVGIE